MSVNITMGTTKIILDTFPEDVCQPGWLREAERYHQSLFGIFFLVPT